MMLFLWLTLTAQAGDVTAQNWQTHPEITEIRLMRKVVESSAIRPGWNRKVQDLQTCAGQHMTKRTILLDDRKKIRRFKTEGAENGVSYRTTQYYDADTKLRFVHLRLTNIQADATADYTLFLDVHGDRLFEHLKRITDDQKVLPADLPQKYLVSRPKKAWAAPSACGSR